MENTKEGATFSHMVSTAWIWSQDMFGYLALANRARDHWEIESKGEKVHMRTCYVFQIRPAFVILFGWKVEKPAADRDR